MILIPIVFLMLLVLGLKLGELSWRSVLAYLLLAVFAALGFSWFKINPAYLFAFLAILDVVLILVIFKGDVRLR